jgi:5'-nucleotidase (lipoprotein e(P4) family)
MPDAVHWVRNSAEYRAAARQAYRLAMSRISQLAASRATGTWAVIVDADETVLDNSTYQKERAAQGLGFTPDSWRAWVARREARTVPGAVEFVGRVRELGGRVAVVTNRTEVECPDTEVNLRDQGLAVDVVLCRPEGSPSDKQARFARISEGTAAQGLPPLEVLMWVGDNILDFPGFTQDVRGDPSKLGEFGGRFILIPNPMYGSWENNPRE